jgi:DNA helicase-2/ATP-dependent DNA helicase PcrA
LLDDQRRIVEHLNGGLLVLAPVGTGKTRVLAERLANAINSGLFEPSRILNLTFTNRAAEEMRNRVRTYLPEAAPKLLVKTFHSLCVYILRFEAKQMGLDPEFVVYDENDSEELVRRIWDIRGKTTEDNKRVSQVLTSLHDCKSKASVRKLGYGLRSKALFEVKGDTSFAEKAVIYQQRLDEHGALDFADLTYLVRAAFQNTEAIAARWRNRFDFLQVDEVQDTHISEYEIVQQLAIRSGNLAMIGDIDQTIYEWRGSTPQQVLDQFRSEFKAVELPLKLNHRATKTLIRAASSFADSYQKRYTACEAAPNRPDGELIRVHHAYDEHAEGVWIANQIRAITAADPRTPLSRIAILTRRNTRSRIISQSLEQAGVACVTVDQFDFFRRQEVKDALGYLRLLQNPKDLYAAKRVLQRPSRSIGNAALRDIVSVRDSGLRLFDFFEPAVLDNGDVYRLLFEKLAQGTVVVLDTETTGLSSTTDDVIEVAAIRLERGVERDALHKYISPTVPIGDSEQVHGISQTLLDTHGVAAHSVLSELAAYTKDAIIVGHNVQFDAKMLRSHAARVGVEFAWAGVYDTLDLARRFVSTENHKLSTLAEHLQIPAKPTHRAIDDTRTTVALLRHLIPLAEEGAAQRRQVIAQHGAKFAELARQIERWRDCSKEKRPAQLLHMVLEESGLLQFYANEGARVENLEQLCEYFGERDNALLQDAPPEFALREIVEHMTMVKQMIDFELKSQDRVPIITVHQSKGLEFDSVFVPGVVEDEMPDFRNQIGARIEEEKRVFYVALTRAKQRLFLSTHAIASGHRRSESRFIQAIDPACLLRE